MNFQLKLKLTFTGKNHKDLDFQSTKNLDTHQTYKHSNKGQTLLYLAGKTEFSIKTRKFYQKNGGKLDKTSYFHQKYKRSPKN